MELSLFSRDVIAQATAVALSHDVFDSVICLGTCDKIVPGLLMGNLAFGHLPTVFIPAGPMTSGIPNAEKAKVRQEFAQGKISRKELMESECASYHGPGTCTFYGTANSNQMLLEVMGLQLPGSGFINPGEEIRDLLTREATETAIKISATKDACLPIGELVDAKTICNAIVGLLATGGSSNHTIHLIAIARCAGIIIDWSDFSELSAITPALTKIYPNGSADVNQFHAAGGMALVISQLLSAGLLHDDVKTILGDGLHNCACDPVLKLALLEGNLGRAIIKTSAVDPKHYDVEAPAKVFTSQAEFLDAFENDELNSDFVAVVVNQGPKSNGMPELHKLTDTISLKTTTGELNVSIDDAEWQSRQQIPHTENLNETDGRILFSNMRATVSSAETGALSLFSPD